MIMAAKDVRFSTDARDRIMPGVEILNKIGQIGSAFRFRPCGRLQCVQCSTTPDLLTSASAVSSRGSQRLEWRDGCCGLNR